MITEDSIAQLLNLYDDNSKITSMSTELNIKFITIQKNKTIHYCSICGSKMHSKGLYKRFPKHQILQDGYELKLTLIGRTWTCSNDTCSNSFADSFSFIEPNKQVTKIIQIQILHALKDINLSTRQVAKQFNVSDTFVHQLFMQYVNPKRLPLTECICIDEVYLNLSPTCKYAIVIMDFKTGDIIDILPSRRKYFTESYFLSIPKEERDKVKFLICDMYKPYINYTQKYFLNSVAITDSFHVLQWLLSLINRYIRQVQKKYQERDKKILDEKNNRSNKKIENPKDSPEVYILKHASWVILRNPKNWVYIQKHYNRFLNRYMDSYDWEESFLNLDDNFRAIRNLKDLYEDFNENYINDIEHAEIRLNELIDIYEASNISIFRDFSRLLKTYKPSILNSFIYIQDNRNNCDTSTLRRLSNGPVESFNNIPSTLRSQSHGLDNFEYARNRILWSQREKEPIHLVPRSKEEIKKVGKKRGSYRKK